MQNKEKRRVAVVTGASTGIGKATAEYLAKSGYKVYGTSRKTQQASSGSFDMLALDVTSDESVESCIQKIIQRDGRIDLLVNNAGFGIAPAAAEESSLDQARTIFDTNFYGVVRMTRAVVPHMRRQGSGRIINIGSVLGFLPMPFMALYSATKHAVAGYSESLDHELRTMGIRVSLVEPAYTNTPFESNQIKADSLLELYRPTGEQIERRVKEALAKGDAPEVVARAVLEAAESPRPKIHYTPGLARKLRFLRRFAPSSLVDAGVRRDLGLEA